MWITANQTNFPHSRTGVRCHSFETSQAPHPPSPKPPYQPQACLIVKNILSPSPISHRILWYGHLLNLITYKSWWLANDIIASLPQRCTWGWWGVWHFLEFNLNWLFYSIILARPWSTLNAQWIINLISRWNPNNNAAWVICADACIPNDKFIKQTVFIEKLGWVCLTDINLMKYVVVDKECAENLFAVFVFYRENLESCRFMKLVSSLFGRLWVKYKNK